MNHFTKNKVSAAISTVLLFSSYAHSADNLVLQSDFESGAFDLWSPTNSVILSTINADTGDGDASNKVLKLTSRTNHGHSAEYSIANMIADHTYVVTAKIKGSHKVGLMITYSKTDGSQESGFIGESIDSNDAWVDVSEMYTLPSDFDAAVPVLISMKTAGDGAAKTTDIFLDDLVIVDPSTDDNYPSNSLFSNTYSNDAENDYWTANNILDKKLDVMRLTASDILDSDKTDGTMNTAYVDSWLATNTDWRWATSDEFTALHGFFNENDVLFLQLNGDVWSPKGGEWSAVAKTDETVLKYTVKPDNFGDIGTSSWNVSNTGRAPLLVREVSAIETLTITAPGDFSTEATAPTTVVDLGSPIITGGDSPAEAIASDTGPFAVGSHTITWSVTDEAGTTVTADQIVTITDETLPVFAELDTITVEATASSTPVTISSVEAADLVSGTITAESDAAASYAVGNHTITWTATDTAGNEATATQTLNITDTTAPVFDAFDDISVSIEGNQYSFVASALNATDNAGGVVSVTTTFVDGDYAPGTYDILWTAVDTLGNSSETTQKLIITSNAAKVIFDLASLPDIEKEATAPTTSVSDDITSVTANNGAVIATADNTGPFAVGTHTITWSATADGETLTQTQTVIISDTTAPVFSETLPTVFIEATDENTPISLIDIIAVDLVAGNVTATSDAPATSTQNPDGFDVTWTATDGANSATKTQKVIVSDTTIPVFDGHDASIAIDATGELTEVTLTPLTATDTLVGDVVITNNMSDVTEPSGSFPIGSTTVTWTATDVAGNQETTTQEVVVTDNTAPIFATLNTIEVYANEFSALAQVTLSDVNAIDAIEGTIVATTDFDGTDLVIGEHTVTWTATDGANSATATQTIIVLEYTDNPPSKLSIETSYSDNSENDYWTANNVDGKQLDIMRLSASDRVNESSEADGGSSYNEINTWLATNSDWRYATLDEMEAIAAFFNLDDGDSNGTKFTTLFGDYYTGKTSWNVAIPTTAQSEGDANPAWVFTGRASSVGSVGYKDNTNADGKGAAALLVREIIVEIDTDGDGVADNVDAFPTDIAASIDTDNDGSPDSWNEGHSANTSTTGLALDAFAQDAAASIDTDNDGFPDSWNEGHSANTSTTGLALDAFAQDASETTDSDEDGVGDNSDAFPNDGNKSVDTPPVITTPSNITVAATDSTGTASTDSLIAVFLTAANANDVDDGNISVSHDAPDIFPLGNTVVTFEATDNGENTVTAQATVTVTDQTAPIISLIGSSSLTLTTSDDYVEQNATGLDNVDGDVTNNIIVGGDTVDTSTLGVYSITYNVSDASGNAALTATRIVTVQDSSAPVITAPENITVAATDSTGTASTEETIIAFLANASANDDIDDVVSISHDAPDVFPLGTTTVTFSATDSYNNTGTNQATVTVTDQTKPVITLVGENSIIIALDDTYADAGFSATDNVDGDISANVLVTGIVNSNAVGTYTLSYNVVDAAGNSADSLTRQISVQDLSAPVVSAPANITVAATDNDGTAISDDDISAFLAFASANDASDGNINVTDNAPNIFPLGITTVIFSATDSAGNIGIAEATVTVTDQNAPIISLVGGTVEIAVGDSYVEPGYSAQDNVDGNVTANVIVTDNIDESTAGTYQLSYNVSDAANNAASQLTRTIIVINIDSDGDGVIDDDDLFPTDPSEWEDTDGDGVGDNSDAFPNDVTETSDSDGDGIGDNSDVFPNDATETTDSDDDGVGDNGDAFPNDATETEDKDEDGIGDNNDPELVDVMPPVFSENNLTIVKDADGILTDISQSLDNLINGNKIGNSISVTDAFDGLVTPIVDSDNLVLPSGLHKVTFSATDEAGNTAFREVPYKILPLVQLGENVIAEAGSTVRIPIKLSGQAPEYPVVVDYLISTSASSSNGQVTFEQDSTTSELVIFVESNAQEGDQIAISTFADNSLHQNVAIPEMLSLTINVISESFAPTIDIIVTQAEQSISTVSPTSGVVTITANINDLNISDEHNISFEVIDSAFTGEFSGELFNSFSFDPTNLDTGKYQVKVTVTETNSADLLSTEVFTSLFIDTTQTEVVADSDQDGIADHLDTDTDTSRLPVAQDEQPLQVQAGLKLVLGEHAQGTDSASITKDLLEADVEFDNISSVTNFNVTGLRVSGESVDIVLPLGQGTIIPEDAVYRKYTDLNGWFNFVEDENNSLSSTIKDKSGNCPAPSSANYLPGLIAGNNCIQLTIEDGGENDGDGLVNGEIVDPGVLVVDHVNHAPQLTTENVTVLSQAKVTLTATASDSDGDNVTYSWIQLAGPSVVLEGTRSNTMTFSAPKVLENTTLVFEVSASDGALTSSQNVEVSVKPNQTSSKSNGGGSFGWLLSLIGISALSRRKFFK
jgi:hypothetical protein